jgi:hypothetical protein
MDAALVVAGHLNDLRTEQVRLERLQTLVSAVPDWSERFRSSGFVRRAPEFREALALDADLDEFLRRSSFQLVPRFAFVQTAMSEFQAQLQPDYLTCPLCHEPTIHIEPSFFDRL